MASYQDLKDRIDSGETIILDGAGGTTLTKMGATPHPVAWCGLVAATHPDVVVQMHEQFIRAGADVITTNTWSTVRPLLEYVGYGDRVREVNALAVQHARQARDNAAGDRPVYIAGSMSSHMVHRNPSEDEIGFGIGAELAPYPQSARYTLEEIEGFYNEMAEVLAESGVDLFLVEPMGRDNEARLIQAKAAKATGLPVWVGFDAYLNDSGTVILGGSERTVPTPEGARVINDDMPLSEAVAEIRAVEPDVMAVFHSSVKDTDAALDVLMNEWSGPAMAYPCASRPALVAGSHDEVTPDDFISTANDWVGRGVQVIGTCCGYGVEYIEPLRETLPDKIASPRAA